MLPEAFFARQKQQSNEIPTQQGFFARQKETKEELVLFASLLIDVPADEEYC
jgi:hypothetical protein